MTEDKEFSLKDKGIWKDYQFKMEDHWYSASDIEMLRHILIEDMRNVDNEYYSFPLDVVIMRINKRFGI
jgi:hypothetical protein